jgi:hypothetical protein
MAGLERKVAWILPPGASRHAPFERPATASGSIAAGAPAGLATRPMR